MELLPLTFASGWTSGINAYLTVLVLGLLGRFAGFEDVPAGLQRTDVLIVAGVLALIEFVADKIPYVDSVWDVASTVVRPAAGAVIGALIAGANGDLLTLGSRRSAVRRRWSAIWSRADSGWRSTPRRNR